MPVFCLLEKLSLAVAALCRLLRPVLELVTDKGRGLVGRVRLGVGMGIEGDAEDAKGEVGTDVRFFPPGNL